jgi:hypothetical protein
MNGRERCAEWREERGMQNERKGEVNRMNGRERCTE